MGSALSFFDPIGRRRREMRTDFYDDQDLQEQDQDPILYDDRVSSRLQVPEMEPDIARPNPFSRFAAPMGAAGSTMPEEIEPPVGLVSSPTGPEEIIVEPEPVNTATAGPEWEGSAHVYNQPRTLLGDVFGDWSDMEAMIGQGGDALMRGVAASGLVEGMVPPAAPTPAAYPNTRMENAPDFSDVQSGFSTKGGFGSPAPPPAPAAEVEPERPRMRAIRMPNGRMMLTNQSGYEGEGINPREIGRMGPSATPTGPTGPVRSGSSTYFPPVNLASETMRALVRNAASNAQFKDAEGNDSSGGAHTNMDEWQLTPDMQQERQMETLGSMAQMGAMTNAARVANMTPQEQAVLDNPEIQSGEWMMKNLVGKMQEIPQKTAAKLRMINDPADPTTYIPDPKMRAARQREIEQAAAEEMAIWQSVMASMMKRDIPSYR